MADVTYPCYKQRKDASGQWYWIYYAKNKEEIARSSESYHNRSDCTHSINLVKNSKDDQIYYYD
ncbi:YegP family protein [Gimibacter soli]|uniref:YegP family protein n=1 Tax=Gimibacter soli TaxID=3024400 RepID=UPI00336576AA